MVGVGGRALSGNISRSSEALRTKLEAEPRHCMVSLLK